MLAAISSFLGSGANIIYFMIVLPLAVGAVLWLVNNYYFRLILALLSAAVNLLFAVSLYRSEGFYLLFPFSSGGLDIAFNVYRFSSLFLTFIAACFLLVILYSVVYLKGKKHAGLFMLYMYISLAMMNGAFMADNLGVLLFFWEGLLCTLFGILLINNLHNPRTAVKALTLSGSADLLMMLGIIITAYQAGTLYISQMEKLLCVGSAAGFACMMLGAIGKAEACLSTAGFPTQRRTPRPPLWWLSQQPWKNSSVPGARIAMDIYDLQPGSGASIAVMTIGT